MTNQRGFIPLLIIILLAILVGGYLVYQTQTKSIPSKQAVVLPPLTPTTKPLPVFEPSVNGMKKYINKTYHYSIKLPESWVIWSNQGNTENHMDFANKEPAEGHMGGITPETLSLRVNFFEKNLYPGLIQEVFDTKMNTTINTGKANQTKLANLTISGLPAAKIAYNSEHQPTEAYYGISYYIRKPDESLYKLEFMAPTQQLLDNNTQLIDQIANSFEVVN